MDNMFETEVDFDNDFQSGNQRITIKWGYEIEARSWGLKDLYVYVPEQEFEVTYEAEDESEVHAKYKIDHCETKMNWSDREHFMVCPETLRLAKTTDGGQAWFLDF